MNVKTDQMETATGTMQPELKKDLQAAHIVPLWESPNALTDEPDQAHVWPWDLTRPIMERAAEITDPEAVMRRALMFVRPDAKSEMDEAITGAITCSLQMILPGERARAHRHSMNAIRFVVEGDGTGATIVDGKRCEMEPGDLILTPGWCWHEHENTGTKPTLWIDVLDVALHQFLGTSKFQPGPASNIPAQVDDEVFAAPGMLPDLELSTRPHSPLFRYRAANAVKALEATPAGPDGLRRVRYVNPLTGEPVMSMLDCAIVQIEGGRTTQPFRSSASTVCVVTEGEGESEIGGKTIAWAKNAVFTIPAGSLASHSAKTDKARFFTVSNRDVFKRLGLLSETTEG
ncbi:cupin domain-containing protein [Actibacterium sp. D379-3]